MSPYLNPFQPFPERQLDPQGVESPRNAVEDNMSRAVFSALANSGSSQAVAMFLEEIAKDQSIQLREHVESFAQTLRSTSASRIEFGLQKWPEIPARERGGNNVLLVGISSSHCNTWTHDQRAAPDKPRADAWIYVPGAMLLVFECKNDDHPLDATQMSAYAHALMLLEGKNVPRALPNEFLSRDEADAVQKACADLVLDAKWDGVAAALEKIDRSDSPNFALCRHAATYIRSHVRPPYQGIQTIVDWLNGADDADRRAHLRTLVNKMREQLEKANDPSAAITFAKEDMRPGVRAALYGPLKRDGKPLERLWLGRKAPVVLWFEFKPEEGVESIQGEFKPVGLEYYIQARGTQPDERRGNDPVIAWNTAADGYLKRAEHLEEEMQRWSRTAAVACRVEVSTVRFKGKKRNWQGSSEQDPVGPWRSNLSAAEALQFLRDNRAELWRFPHVDTASEIADAAKKVRKPALGLIAPLDTAALAACGLDDDKELQAELQKAVAHVESLAESQ